jgi:tyrosine-protein phosphatase SIW14
MKALLCIIALLLSACASATAGPYQGSYVDVNITRGPMPSDAQIDELKAQGYVNYLNLMDADSVIDRADVMHLSQKWGDYFVNEPMSNETAPTKEALIRSAVSLHTWNLMGDKSLVTCRHGQDRTGFVVAVYRMMYQHYTAQQAYEEALSMGHNQLYDGFPFYWKKVLWEIESELKGGK